MIRARKVVIAIIAVAIAALLLPLILPTRLRAPPPTLTLVKMEPIHIIDDSGMEMWVVTLIITDSDIRPPKPENSEYVANSGSRIEAKVAGRWIEVPGSLECSLGPGIISERMLLLPARTDACRVCLKYTDAALYNGRIEWLAEHLPSFIRVRFSYKFWRWAGFQQYGPSSNWREIHLDLPLPPRSAASGHST